MTPHPEELELSGPAPMPAGRFPISSGVISGFSVAVDSVAILGSGIWLYAQMIHVDQETIGMYLGAVFAIWISILMLFQFSELYRFDAITRPFGNLLKIAIAFFTGFLFLLAAAFAFKISGSFSRVWVSAFGVSALLATTAARIVFSRAVVLLWHRGVFSRNTIIVGDGHYVTRFLNRILDIRPDFVAVTALFVDGYEHGGAPEPRPVAGNLSNIPAYVRSSRVDDVIIAMPWSAESKIVALVDELRELPVNVYLGSDLIGLKLDFRDPPGHFDGTPVYAVVGHPMSDWSSALKTIEDYLLAATALLIAALPMLLIALLIRLDSPGPVLFRQKRFGFNNRVFWIYKFRTMHHSDISEEKTVQARVDDNRVTTIGKFLRRTSLDELPQLLNVLNGTMSLVGPRPHTVDHNEEYSQSIRGYFSRHRVKPGITGWAQVNGFRGETNAPEKMEARVRHDVYYAENWSLFFDLRILVQTIFVVVSGRNAY